MDYINNGNLFAEHPVRIDGVTQRRNSSVGVVRLDWRTRVKELECGRNKGIFCDRPLLEQVGPVGPPRAAGTHFYSGHAVRFRHLGTVTEWIM